MYNANYNGFYDEFELEQNARMAHDLYGLSLAGFEMFNHRAEESMRRFQGFTNKLVRELPHIKKDLKDQMSLVNETTRQNLDQVLQNQSATLASMSGGPLGMSMRNIMNRSTKMYNDQMNQGRIAMIQEEQARNKTYYDVLHDRMQLIHAGESSLSQLVTSVGAQNAQLTQAGMQASIDTARNLVGLRMGAAEQDIQRSKLRYDWARSLLNAETSVYGSQLSYMANSFNTLATHEAAKYDTDIKALTQVYNSSAEQNRSMFNAAMTGMVGLYQTMVNSRDKQRMAAQMVGLNLRSMDVWSDANAATNRANIIAGSMGQPLNIMQYILDNVDNIAPVQSTNSRATASDYMRSLAILYGSYNQPKEEEAKE